MIAAVIIAAVPDVPREVKVQMHRENELEQQLLFDDGYEDQDQGMKTSHQTSNGTGLASTMTAKEIPSIDQNYDPNLRWIILV